MGGIEPLTQAWEAGVLPLNYIRARTLYHGGGGMSRAVRKIFCLPVRFFAGVFCRADPTCSAGKGDPSPHPAGPEKQEIRTETGPDRFLRVKGLEPSRSCPHKNLNLARLPIPPHPRGSFFRTVLLYQRREALSRGFGKVFSRLAFLPLLRYTEKKRAGFAEREIRNRKTGHGMGERR